MSESLYQVFMSPCTHDKEIIERRVRVSGKMDEKTNLDKNVDSYSEIKEMSELLRQVLMHGNVLGYLG